MYIIETTGSSIPTRAQNMPMRPAERNRILIALAMTVLMACGRESSPPPPASRSIVADVVISVANHTSQEKQIILEGRSLEHTLGVVPGNSSRSFSVPSGAGDSTSELRLEARDRRETSGVRSTMFLLSSGKRVVWTLEKSGQGMVVTR